MAAAKALLFVVAIFLFSMYQSCTELRYLGSGAEAQAVVSGVSEHRTRRNKQTGRLDVHWNFRVDSKGYAGGMVAEPELARSLLEQNTVTIEYLSGDPRVNRLSGDVSYGWISIFLICTVAMIALAVVAYFQAKADLDRAKRLG